MLRAGSSFLQYIKRVFLAFWPALLVTPATGNSRGGSVDDQLQPPAACFSDKGVRRANCKHAFSLGVWWWVIATMKPAILVPLTAWGGMKLLLQWLPSSAFPVPPQGPGLKSSSDCRDMAAMQEAGSYSFDHGFRCLPHPEGLSCMQTESFELAAFSPLVHQRMHQFTTDWPLFYLLHHLIQIFNDWYLFL